MLSGAPTAQEKSVDAVSKLEIPRSSVKRIMKLNTEVNAIAQVRYLSPVLYVPLGSASRLGTGSSSGHVQGHGAYL
jgi:hypothetical protein